MPNSQGRCVRVGESRRADGGGDASGWYYEIDVVVPHLVLAAGPFVALLVLRRLAIGGWR